MQVRLTATCWLSPHGPRQLEARPCLGDAASDPERVAQPGAGALDLPVRGVRSPALTVSIGHALRVNGPPLPGEPRSVPGAGVAAQPWAATAGVGLQ